MIDGTEFFVDENNDNDSTRSISKKEVEFRQEFLAENLNGALSKTDNLESSDDKDPLSDDEARPGTSASLSPQAKENISPSIAKPSNFSQSNNKDGKVEPGVALPRSSHRLKSS